MGMDARPRKAEQSDIPVKKYLLTSGAVASPDNRELNELNDGLKLALKYAEAVINTAHQPFLVLDKDLRIIRANPAFYKAFQTTPDTTEGQLLYDLGDRQWDIPELCQSLQALLLLDASFKDCEITRVFPDVGKKTVRLNGTNMAPGEEQFQILLAIEDISDYRAAMNILKESNEYLEEFAHIASHDLREPLRGMQNHAHLLLKDYGDKLDEKAVHRLKRLVYLSQRTTNLIRDLLYFSLLGRSDIAVEKTDTNGVINEVRDMLESLLQERNAQIIVPKPLPHIACDKTKVTEVFTNLITNAVKYNDKPEPVVEIGFLDMLETPQAREKDVFYVKDNGIGIEPEFHQEIFRLFRRLHPSSDKNTRGTGAGLTFVKKIIERHNGRVWVESEPGKGATFYFTLDQGKICHE
jgi:signal transduction histidine kinase